MYQKSKSIFIEKLTLENWAQFENNTLNFPVPKTQSDGIPIIYFIGRNGSGKTRLFQAIRVALFGKNDTSIGQNPNLFDFFPAMKKEKFISKLENREPISNQKIKIVVTFLEINKDGIKFHHKIIRSFIFSDFSLTLKASKPHLTAKLINEMCEYKYSDTPFSWTDREFKEIEKKINDWFPPEVREFYFFDGEKLNDLMVTNRDRKDDLIKNKILKKSDHYKLERILEKISIIAKRFDETAGKKQRKSELVEQGIKDVKDLEKKLKKFERDFSNLTDEIASISKRLNELTSLIENLGVSPENLKKISENKTKLENFRELDKEFDIKYSELSQLLGNNKDKIYNFQWLLISSILDEVYNDLHDKMEKGIIPTKLDQGTYNIFLNRGICLCGKQINEVMKNHIIKEKEKVVDEELNDEAKRFLNVLEAQKHDINEKRENVTEAKTKCIKVITDLQNLGDRPGEDKDQEKLFQEYIKYKNEKVDLEKKYDRKQRSLTELTKKISEVKDNLDSARARLHKRKLAEGKIEKDDRYAYFAFLIQRKFEKLKEKLNKNIIEYIKAQTNKTFLQLIEPKNKYEGVYIGEDWSFGYYMKDSPTVPILGEIGPSKGQFHVLGISFLHSISGTTSSNLPIFFDTPLGRIDKEHKVNIGSNLPSLFKGSQIILFLTAAEA
ncbi:MAG: hypothetical protein ACTSO2_17720, partial [Promethearchaeota archaeon]